MPSKRVLVVDDHAVVRRSVCSLLLLSIDPTLEIIKPTEDGEEGVRKADELQPDLVLLDIGLPGISGIEAARRIRKVSPQSQILFLSQYDSLSMVKEAMDLGAQGYIVKSDMARDLLKGIRSVLDRKLFFVSDRLLAQSWSTSSMFDGTCGT
jgi:two-component system, NarL family, invasion response regulator UvrY